MQIILYASFATLLFVLIKVITNPKKESVRELSKEALIVFISSILGSYAANKFGNTEIKVAKTAQVFTDNAGF